MKRRIGKAAGLLVYAIDGTGDRGSAHGRTYGVTSQGHGLAMSVAEWRAVAALIDRDTLRDAVPLPARRRAASKRKRRS